MNNSLKFIFYHSILLLALIASCTSDDTKDINEDTEENTNEDEEVTETTFNQTIEWIKTFGGTNEDSALSVVEATDGGYVLAGYTQSTDGDLTGKTATDSDFWVLKLTKDGAISWSKTYGGTGDERAEKIIATKDGGYIVVGYNRSSDGDVSQNEGLQDYWVIKINASGELQWEKSFGFGGIDRAFSVIQTEDNGYFVTGFFDVSLSNGGGNDDGPSSASKNKNTQKHGVGEFWGIKLNEAGETEWRRYFGGNDNDRSYDVVQTKDGGFLMIGSSESESGSADVSDISVNLGSYDYWAVKIDAQGNLVWEKTYGGTEIDVAYGIAAVGDGTYIIVGDARSADVNVSNAKGNADLWIIRIDDNGNMLWEKAIGGTQFDTGRGIHKTKNGHFIITGNSRSNDVDLDKNNGQSDILSIVINDKGDVLWKSIVGGGQAEFATGCIETTDKKFVIVGNSESDDLDIPENKGSKDLILIKYKE
ncbi:hypothetical protein ABW636_10780 [Aquimarina sp. 2201CG1-2-11]|uniref:hypothetical protein n=1 Tax=Aquimarina discodermiae TaxID=3231043 RepID=UPI003461C90F